MCLISLARNLILPTLTMVLSEVQKLEPRWAVLLRHMAHNDVLQALKGYPTELWSERQSNGQISWLMDSSDNVDLSHRAMSAYLQWDEFCDLLGGAHWEHAYAQWRTPGLSAEREASMSSLVSRFANSRQFLFEDRKDCLLLEVFWLKWNLFTALCRQILKLHREQQRPHLALHPATVHLQFGAASACWLPARWSFTVEILAQQGACPFTHNAMPTEMAQCLFVPPPGLNPIYTAPVMRDWPLGREVPVTALIQSVDRIHEDLESVARGMVRVHVISDSIAAGDFSERDVFHLIIPLSRVAPDVVHLWARKVESAERGLVVSGVTDPLPSQAWGRFEQGSREVFSNARASVYRAFHVPCDLYSLAMLLIRSLLVNEKQRFQQIEEALFRVVNRLDPVVHGLDIQDHHTLTKRIADRLKEEGTLFSSSALVYSGADDGLAHSSVPDELWYGALTLALRLVSWIPGFSFCPRPGVYDARRVHGPMEEVLHAVEHVGEQIRIELFEVGTRNREIQQACHRVLAELTVVRNR